MAGKYYKSDIYTYVKTCAKCGSKNIKTINTDVRQMGHVYRQKVCRDCGYNFGTIEVEKCVSEVGTLLQEIEDLKKEKQALEIRLNSIKDYVRRV